MDLNCSKVFPAYLEKKIKKTDAGFWNRDHIFRKAAYVFIQAPSGRGKTSLIHILYGLMKDFKGTVQWGNQPIHKMNKTAIADFRSKRVSIVFQDLRLFPSLTLWENLELKNALTNHKSGAEIENMLELLGIADKKNTLAQTLSYGERQRASIIRSLLQPFEWLLMDEPFSHLDNENIEKAVALIQGELQTQKAGLILADLEPNTYFPYHQNIRM